MRAWLLATAWPGVPRWRWFAFVAVGALVALVWVAGWPLIAAVLALLASPPWARRAVPVSLEHDAAEASGRASTISHQADARDAQLRAREEAIRDRVRQMDDEELARELERTRRPR